jgi:enoyl-CoA hydratase/carnithine racemase
MLAGQMTDNSGVVLEKHRRTLQITINRPEKCDAINGDVVAGIARGYREAHDDPDVRVTFSLVLATRHFRSAGTCSKAVSPLLSIMPSRMSTTPI